MSALERQLNKLLGDGWEVVNSGRVLIPFEAKTPKPSFSERVEGFVGAAAGEMLIDDDERWFQLRRRPSRASALRCETCGYAFADDNDTTHECPPGFTV